MFPQTIPTKNTMSIPYITLEQDVIEKLEIALSTNKPLLILYKSSIGQHQLSGFVTAIDEQGDWILIENGSMVNKILISQVLLVVEWK